MAIESLDWRIEQAHLSGMESVSGLPEAWMRVHLFPGPKRGARKPGRSRYLGQGHPPALNRDQKGAAH